MIASLIMDWMTRCERRYNQLAARTGKWALRRLYATTPVPLRSLELLRRTLTEADGLFPASTATKGAAVREPFLAAALCETELGVWTLSASTLNFLEQQIQQLRPRLIVEFGSGVSTICFARYMQALHGDRDKVYVISIDQSEAFVQQTIDSLKKLQLARHARVFHAPLCRQTIEGVDSVFYDLPVDAIAPLFVGTQADLVVIDGPSIEYPARFGTLPLVRRWLSPQAMFFLDDALRDGELKVARLWSRLPYVAIDGIHVDGKGLLQGRLVETPLKGVDRRGLSSTRAGNAE